MLSPKVEHHLKNVLRHLYINPLEKCNLRCKICYTSKTSPILSMKEILSFVDAYQSSQPIDSITFCGGEVFALQYFPELLNQMETRHIFAQVITNGTIDKLAAIKNPNNVNLIVSIDGIEQLHDANRGEGTFRKSLHFMKKAHSLGFHLEVFSIIHKQNIDSIEIFEQTLLNELGFQPEVTYHPRKPPKYLQSHPISNIVGEVEGFDFLTTSEIVQLMKTKTVFPPPDLGCYQIAVASDGKVYGCCEGTIPLGTIKDQPIELMANLRARLEEWSKTDTSIGCLGCSQHQFMCGIKEYLLALAKEPTAKKTT